MKYVLLKENPITIINMDEIWHDLSRKKGDIHTYKHRINNKVFSIHSKET